jgi:enterobacterial common antigen flippase
VREVADANGSGDSKRLACVIKTLRRVCWFTGIFGWFLTAALAWPLSQWTFGSAERMWTVSILGVTVLAGAVTAGQAALLQGMRKIGDLARIQVYSAILTTLVAVGLYAWLGERGIVPVIILTAFIQLGFSWYFSRRIHLAHVDQLWIVTATNSKRLVRLGLAFMYGSLLVAIVGVSTRSIIVRDFGVEANGIYQAALGLSGLFAGFILGAMGADFFPRLTEVVDDHAEVNRVVNEQIEVGILLALPGLMVTLTFAPWLLHLFYSAKFISGAALLPWLVIATFGQVFIWPMGMIQSAKGITKWMYFSRTFANILQLLLTILFVRWYHLTGVAYAFVIATIIHGFVTYGIAYHLSGFFGSHSTIRLSLFSLILIAFAILISNLQDIVFLSTTGLILTTGASLFSVRGICKRLGVNSPIVKTVLRIPGSRIVCGL